jgi:leucyl aminopeptidase
MSLPAGFAMPDPALTPCRCTSLDKATASPRGATRSPPAVQAWLAAQRFDGSAGTRVAGRMRDGAIGGAVIGIGDRAGSLQLRTCAAGPAGWRLAVLAIPDAADAPRAATRLGPGQLPLRPLQEKPRAPARLVDAFDAEALDLLAACVRVRDLVNTPTEHMGPQRAGRRGARTRRQRTARQLDRDRRRRAAGAELPGHPRRRPRLAPRAAPDRAALGRRVASARRDLVGKGVCFDTGGLDLKPPTACAT